MSNSRIEVCQTHMTWVLPASRHTPLAKSASFFQLCFYSRTIRTNAIDNRTRQKLNIQNTCCACLQPCANQPSFSLSSSLPRPSTTLPACFTACFEATALPFLRVIDSLNTVDALSLIFFFDLHLYSSQRKFSANLLDGS